MRLNTLRPAQGSKKTRVRVGRGTGCGFGKTCGRGYNGQHSRSGGYQKTGFEGGQMPLQRRLPKYGFRSHSAAYRTEINLRDLLKLSESPVTITVLKKENLINKNIQAVKVMASKETVLKKPFILQGLSVTKRVKQMIEEAGGRVE